MPPLSLKSLGANQRDPFHEPFTSRFLTDLERQNAVDRKAIDARGMCGIQLDRGPAIGALTADQGSFEENRSPASIAVDFVGRIRARCLVHVCLLLPPGPDLCDHRRQVLFHDRHIVVDRDLLDMMAKRALQ